MLSTHSSLPNFCQKFLDDYQRICEGLPDCKSLDAIRQNSENAALNKEGICYSLIKCYREKQEQSRHIREAEKHIARHAEYIDERDALFNNTVLHWCAALSLNILADFYITRTNASFQLKKINNIGLNPMQLAIFLGNRQFVLQRLKVVPEFSPLNFNNGLKEIQLSELHLAILLGDLELVKEIFNIFKQNGVSIDVEFHSNILQIVVYSALLERHVTGKTFTNKSHQMVKIIKENVRDGIFKNFLLAGGTENSAKLLADKYNLASLFDSSVVADSKNLSLQKIEDYSLLVSLPMTPIKIIKKSDAAESKKDINQISNISESDDVLPSFSQSILQLHKIIAEGLPDHKTLCEIIVDPTLVDLKKQGLCYKIIKGYKEKEEEKAVIKKILNMGEDEISVFFHEADAKFHNTPIHWAVASFYNLLGKVLIDNGFDLNKVNKNGLNPMQLAVFLGNNEFVLNRFDKLPKFSKFKVKIGSNDIELNELHLAILLSQKELVVGIINIFKKRGCPINMSERVSTELNILHLIIYAAIIERKLTKNPVPSCAIQITNIVKICVGESEFKNLLSSSINTISPEALAIQYGLKQLFHSQSLANSTFSLKLALPNNLTIVVKENDTSAESKQNISSKNTISINASAETKNDVVIVPADIKSSAIKMNRSHSVEPVPDALGNTQAAKQDLISTSLNFFSNTLPSGSLLVTKSPSQHIESAEPLFLLGIKYAYEKGNPHNPQGNDEKKAIECFEKTIIKEEKQKGPFTQFILGYKHEHGFGFPKNDRKAIAYYGESATQGNADAYINLGLCMSRGGARDSAKVAFSCYQKAAAQNNARAQYNLGCCFVTGSGVFRNEQTAYEWFHKSAIQGYALGQYSVGLCYEQGIGIAKNEKASIEWYVRSARQGNNNALNKLNALNLSNLIQQSSSVNADMKVDANTVEPEKEEIISESDQPAPPGGIKITQ